MNTKKQTYDYTRGAWKFAGFVAFCVVVFWLVILATGCTSTVIPVKVTPKAASFDGAAQSSGILDIGPNNSRIVTSHYRERYNALIQTYGALFNPPLKADEGIHAYGDNWLIDAQHHAAFLRMNQRRLQEGK